MKLQSEKCELNPRMWIRQEEDWGKTREYQLQKFKTLKKKVGEAPWICEGNRENLLWLWQRTWPFIKIPIVSLQLPRYASQSWFDVSHCHVWNYNINLMLNYKNVDEFCKIFIWILEIWNLFQNNIRTQNHYKYTLTKDMAAKLRGKFSQGLIFVLLWE